MMEHTAKVINKERTRMSRTVRHKHTPAGLIARMGYLLTEWERQSLVRRYTVWWFFVGGLSGTLITNLVWLFR